MNKINKREKDLKDLQNFIKKKILIKFCKKKIFSEKNFLTTKISKKRIF